MAEISKLAYFGCKMKLQRYPKQCLGGLDFKIVMLWVQNLGNRDTHTEAGSADRKSVSRGGSARDG